MYNIFLVEDSFVILLYMYIYNYYNNTVKFDKNGVCEDLIIMLCPYY